MFLTTDNLSISVLVQVLFYQVTIVKLFCAYTGSTSTQNTVLLTCILLHTHSSEENYLKDYFDILT